MVHEIYFFKFKLFEMTTIYLQFHESFLNHACYKLLKAKCLNYIDQFAKCM